MLKIRGLSASWNAIKITFFLSASWNAVNKDFWNIVFNIIP